MPDQQHADTSGGAPRPTSALPVPATTSDAAMGAALTQGAEAPHGTEAFGAWPGFPFPPPLMGLSWHSVHAAAAHWLRALADLLEDGELNLNVLFSTGPITATCDAFGLPSTCAYQVVTAAALYTLGATSPQPTLTAVFAAPASLHPARLRQAADELDQ
jgi:hypothetical protein